MSNLFPKGFAFFYQSLLLLCGYLESCLYTLWNKITSWNRKSYKFDAHFFGKLTRIYPRPFFQSFGRLWKACLYHFCLNQEKLVLLFQHPKRERPKFLSIQIYFCTVLWKLQNYLKKCVKLQKQIHYIHYKPFHEVNFYVKENCKQLPVFHTVQFGVEITKFTFSFIWQKFRESSVFNK